MVLLNADFEVLRGYVRRVAGIELGDEKDYLVRQRFGPVARAHGCESLHALAELVARGPSLALREALIAAITTNETSFFRDGHPYEALRAELLPALAELVAERRRLGGAPGAARASFLSAGAATGQEAYSIAMCVAEQPPGGLAPHDVSILGVDVSRPAIAQAEAGAYSEAEIARGLDASRRERFFERDGRRYVARPELRRLVDFRVLNFAEPLPALGPFDVIFCRNTLIYFGTAMKQQVLRRFMELQGPGGYLVLGATETLYGLSDGYAAMSIGDTTVYRRS